MNRTPVCAAWLAALCASAVLLTFAAAGFSAAAQLVPYGFCVLLAGYLLPMNWAVGCAILAPLLCTCFLGIPEPVAELPLTVCQLIAMAAFANFFYGMLGSNVYTVLVVSEAAGFVLLFCAAAIYGAVSPQDIRPLSWVRATFAATWPGILLQAAAAPPLVLAIERAAARFAATHRV